MPMTWAERADKALQSRTWRFVQGDAAAQLRELPAEFVHCVVTSVPYWGLRSYLRCPACDEPSSKPTCKCGHFNPEKLLECGLEKSPAAWVDALVAVFREVKRVMLPHGVLWLNCGSAMASDDIDGDEYVLRDDLTLEEVEFVFKELLHAKTGVAVP